ncbi:DoxX family protein [Actinopolymorpha sp. B11F2]|uniref:DoxX family protein n=1 Tax=Actinopolymorpha sp. B11F2 TaxID=3160862 RepID=UPI0032E386C0
MTTNEAVAGTQAIRTTTPPRWANIGMWVLQALLALTYLFSGVNKVGGEAQTVAGFDAIGWGDWFRVLIGVLELAGAVALMIPILSGLAALAFTGLMIGAVIMTVAVYGDLALAVIPATVGILVAIVAWGRRHRTTQLWALLRSRRS